jgi:hypothetical protein
MVPPFSPFFLSFPFFLHASLLCRRCHLINIITIKLSYHHESQGQHTSSIMAVQINTPLSFWVQLACFFFILAGIHSDLLVIRFFLFLAYCMLFLNAALGSPLWPNSSNPQHISVDAILWGLVGMYVHGASLLCLILDERKVELDKDETALWRMFYRTGGLSARLYKNIVSPYVQVVEFQPGESIPTDNCFYIVYKGMVHLKVYAGNVLQVDRKFVKSGEMFDLKYIGMFQEDSVFNTHRLECSSVTHTKLFQFSRNDMKKIAHHRFAKTIWQALLINNLSFVVESYIWKNGDVPATSGLQVDKIFTPLEPWEEPKPALAGSGSALQRPLQHLTASIQKSFGPPPPFGGHPTGIRQTLLHAPAQQSTEDPQRMPPLHHLSELSTHHIRELALSGDTFTVETRQNIGDERPQSHTSLHV